jgi:hypothetical protein
MAEAPEPGAVYAVELCSGERRRWRCLAADAGGAPRWRDLDSGTDYGAAGPLYAWRIVARIDPASIPEENDP